MSVGASERIENREDSHGQGKDKGLGRRPSATLAQTYARNLENEPIDLARPRNCLLLRCRTANWAARLPRWVTSGRTQSEHNESAVPREADIGARGRHVALGPTADSRSAANIGTSANHPSLTTVTVIGSLIVMLARWPILAVTLAMLAGTLLSIAPIRAFEPARARIMSGLRGTEPLPVLHGRASHAGKRPRLSLAHQQRRPHVVPVRHGAHCEIELDIFRQDCACCL